MRAERRMIRAGDVDLCVESFGDPEHPAVLLIMGAAASMDWWPEEFCRGLAEHERFVIRYDLRDTGETTTWPAGAPGYTSADLVDDAVAVLDAFGVGAAHVVGMSMGGGIAQWLALVAPDRVASLTLISTTPIAPVTPPLPAMSEELAAAFSQPAAAIDWSDREAVVGHVTAETQCMQGSRRVDESALRDLVGRVFDRSQDMAATMGNHFALEVGELPEPDLTSIKVPTAVLHGTEDPLFPLPHGQALVDAIAGARLVPLDRVGHGELPPAIHHAAIAAIVEVTSTA